MERISSDILPTGFRSYRPRPGALLTAAAFLTPPLAVFGSLAIAPLLALIAIALIVIEPRKTIAAALSWPIFAGLLTALSLWCAASTFWSILPQHSFLEGLRLLAISLAGLIVLGHAAALDPRDGRRLGKGITAGIVAALVLLFVERTSDAALTRLVIHPGLGLPIAWARFDHGATTLVLTLWAALAGSRRRARRDVVLIAAAVVIVMMMASHAAMLAAVAGLTAFAAAWCAPRSVAAALAITLVCFAAVFPLVVPDHGTAVRLHQEHPILHGSALHRLLIWRFTADRIAERPLLGWGMDAARAIPGGKTDLTATLTGTDLPPGAEALPLHPHDAALQWRLELGVPGTLLALAAVLWPLAQISRTPSLTRRARASALAFAASAMVVALISYGIWQAWWLSCLWLTAAFIAGAARGQHAG